MAKTRLLAAMRVRGPTYNYLLIGSFQKTCIPPLQTKLEVKPPPLIFFSERAGIREIAQALGLGVDVKISLNRYTCLYFK